MARFVPLQTSGPVSGKEASASRAPGKCVHEKGRFSRPNRLIAPDSSRSGLAKTSRAHYSTIYARTTALLEQVSPFYARTMAFLEQVTPFYARIMTFLEQVSPFYARTTAIPEQVSPFYARTMALPEQVSPFYARTMAFPEQVSLFYRREKAFNGHLSPFCLPEGAEDARLSRRAGYNGDGSLCLTVLTAFQAVWFAKALPGRPSW